MNNSSSTPTTANSQPTTTSLTLSYSNTKEIIMNNNQNSNAVRSHTTTLRNRMVASLAALVLAATPLAFAANNVYSELNREFGGWQYQGLRLVDTGWGRLYEGDDQDISMVLYAGYTYRIAAVCGSCIDLDLELRDASWRYVTADNDYDNTPWIEVTPRRTQTYTLNVNMTETFQSTSEFLVGIYRY
jgi:hypothetical protein